MQKEEPNPKSQIFSDVTSLQERMDGKTEGSSFSFIPLCKRIAWQLGVSTFKVIRFLMDNPGILTLPIFASLIPSVNGSSDCLIKCINTCNEGYVALHNAGLTGLELEAQFQLCLVLCGQGCGREKGYGQEEL
jgi:hypothetical protein